jgi:arginyl-tRNA synthetase
MNFKEELLQILSDQIKESITLEVPPNPVFGDFALPCFKLSKKAHELQKILKLPKFIEKTELKGPYINFFLKKDYLAEQTIKEILKLKDKYGSNQEGKGQQVLVEHTSINPNASPHVGRARNAIIGDSIVRILKFQDYKLDTHYFVNDVGKQIAMLVLATKGKVPKFEKILDLYIEFNKKLEDNPKLEEQIFEILNKLEKKDPKTLKQFQKVVQTCVKGQTKILSELGIKYDHFDYESKFLFNKETDEILKKLKDKGKLFTDEEGRQAINLEGFDLPMENPYLPLTRKDGTSLYMLRDIAYAIHKSKIGKDRNIIVLGEDQKLYFMQLKTILSVLGYNAPEVIHYSFVLLPSGKMSTRKGEVVLLEDLMKEIKEKATEEIKTRHKNMKSPAKLAHVIGYGALKFAILKVSADKNIIFDMEKALSFEGESAPYVQYSHARANSILKNTKINQVDYSLLTTPEEMKLISKLSQFPEVVKNVSLSLQPHLIVQYSIDLAKTFNEFYHTCQVLNTEEPLRSTRLQLVFSTKQVLKNSLSLLGIEAPDMM